MDINSNKVEVEKLPVAPVIGAAIIGGGASILSSRSQTNAANTAASAQIDAAQLGIDENRRQFDEIQALLAPFAQGGTSSFGAQMNLLGLNGDEAQQTAIDGLEQSPYFQSLVQTGEEAILQNASATGGLRGGNTQAALAQFRPEMLARTIENQFRNLGSLSQIGLGAATGTGNFGANSTSNITGLLSDQGAAGAGAALARGQASANLWGDLANAGGTIIGALGGSGGFGGVGTPPIVPTTGPLPGGRTVTI